MQPGTYALCYVPIGRTTERRTAMVGLELQRYGIDIAVLSESRLPESGSLTEDSAGYTFYWSGLPKEERRMHGVCLAIRKEIAKHLKFLPVAVNERLITLRLSTNTENRYVTIIGVYAPTMTYDDNTKETFYSQLDRCIRKAPKEDKLFIMGDFNARVGTHHAAWPKTLGRHGVGKCNSNGLLLLTKCMEHELAITNTFFEQPMKNKTTWMHPRSKKWHQLDYIICRQKHLKEVTISKSIRGANCETDHHMVCCKTTCVIQPPRKKIGSKPQRKFDVIRLKQPGTSQEFKEALRDTLNVAAQSAMQDTNTGINESWSALRDATVKAAEKTIGFAKKKSRDWFNDNAAEMTPLLDEKNKLYQQWLSTGTRRSRQRFYNHQKQIRTKTRK